MAFAIWEGKLYPGGSQFSVSLVSAVSLVFSRRYLPCFLRSFLWFSPHFPAFLRVFDYESILLGRQSSAHIRMGALWLFRTKLLDATTY